MRIEMALLFGAVLASFSWQPAHAQNIFGERDDILNTLSKRYHEVPVSMGLSGNGGLVEILASKKGSWTIIVTRPSGVACVVSTGESWERLKGPSEEGTGI